MPPLAKIIANQDRVKEHRPWPRVRVADELWLHIAHQLADGRATLLGLWGEWGSVPAVHMAIAGADGGESAVVSIICPAGIFPPVGALPPPAIRLERGIASLYGLQPVGAPDTRPWLDLGFWDVKYPLGSRS